MSESRTATSSSCLRGPRQFHSVSEIPQEVQLKGRLGQGATGWVDRKLIQWQDVPRDVAEKHHFFDITEPFDRQKLKLEREVWNTHFASPSTSVLGYRFNEDEDEAVIWQDYLPGESLAETWAASDAAKLLFTLPVVSVLAVDLLIQLQRLVELGISHNDIYHRNVLVDWNDEGMPHFSLIDWDRGCGEELQRVNHDLHPQNRCFIDRSRMAGMDIGPHYLYRSPFLAMRFNSGWVGALRRHQRECGQQGGHHAFGGSRKIEKDASDPLLSVISPSPRDTDFLDETALLQRNDQWSVGMLILSTLIPDFVWWNYVPGQQIVRQALQEAGLPSQLDDRGYIIFDDDDDDSALYENFKFAQVLEAVSPANHLAALEATIEETSGYPDDPEDAEGVWRQLKDLWNPQRDSAVLSDIIVTLTDPHAICVNLFDLEAQVRKDSAFFDGLWQLEEKAFRDAENQRLCSDVRDSIRNTAWQHDNPHYASLQRTSNSIAESSGEIETFAPDANEIEKPKAKKESKSFLDLLTPPSAPKDEVKSSIFTFFT